MANLEIIKNRWQSANKIKGLQNVITLPDGTTISGTYYLAEAGCVTASHNSLDGFTI
jgi:hypothetical protein